MRTRVLSVCGVVVCASFWAWANHPPRAHSSVIFAEPNKPVEIQLFAEDPDGDPLTFEFLEPVNFGHFLGAPPSLVYWPTPGFTGTLRLSFRVSDPYGAFDLAFLEIRIGQMTPSLRIVTKGSQSPFLPQLVDFLLQQGVRTWYVVDLEPRTFPPMVVPFVFAASHSAFQVFVIGPLEAPEIHRVEQGSSYVFAADLRFASPGEYFFLALSGDQAFSYPFRIALPKPIQILAHAGGM